MNRTMAMLVSRGWLSICSFATFVVIGRSLTPESFGLFALASSIALMPHMVVGAGFYERTLSHGGGKGGVDDDTAYWCIVGTGVGAMLVVFAMALCAGFFFHSWPMARLLAPLGIASLLSGFALPLEAQLLRDGEGKRVAIVLTSAETIGLATLIASLWLGCGVFSLVLQRIANQATIAIGYPIAAKKFFAKTFDVKSALGQTRFSIGMLFARFVGWADGYGGDILLAAVLSASGLGLYRMGGRLYLAGAGVLLQSPGTAALAYIGKARETSERRMARTCYRTMRLHGALALPLFAGLAATASEITPLFLGPEWAGVAAVTSIFCVLAPSVVLQNIYNAVLVARGHTRVYSIVNAAVAVIGVVAIFLGSFWGAPGAIAAKAVAIVAFSVAMTLVLHVLEKENRKRAMLSFFAICAAALCMWAGVAQMIALIGVDPHPLARLTRVAVGGAFGMVVYVGALRLLAPASFKLTRRVLMLIVRRIAPRKNTKLSYAA